MYHQLEHTKIVYGAHIAFICWVWISEQTGTFVSYSSNRLVCI